MAEVKTEVRFAVLENIDFRGKKRDKKRVSTGPLEGSPKVLCKGLQQGKF
jgi:hypothetical protein